MDEVIIHSTITCPECGFQKEESCLPMRVSSFMNVKIVMQF